MEKKPKREVEVIDLLNKAGSNLIMDYNWGPSLLISLSKTYTDCSDLSYYSLIEVSGFSLIGKLERAGIGKKLHDPVSSLVGGAEVLKEYNNHAVSDAFIKAIAYVLLAVVGYTAGMFLANIFILLSGFTPTDTLELLDFLKNE